MRNHVMMCAAVLAFSVGCVDRGMVDAASTEQGTTVSTTSPAPQLKPIFWLVGDWRCSGAYLDTPITVAHPAVASFHVAVGVGGSWIVGDYRETNPNPVSVLDELSVDPRGVGIRSFTDSNTGQLTATFTPVANSDIDWTGTYLIAGMPVPFHEHLTAAASLQRFDIDSQINLGLGFQSFQRLTCTKVSDGTTGPTAIVLPPTETLQLAAHVAPADVPSPGCVQLGGGTALCKCWNDTHCASSDCTGHKCSGADYPDRYGTCISDDFLTSPIAVASSSVAAL